MGKCDSTEEENLMPGVVPSAQGGYRSGGRPPVPPDVRVCVADGKNRHSIGHANSDKSGVALHDSDCHPGNPSYRRDKSRVVIRSRDEMQGIVR